MLRCCSTERCPYCSDLCSLLPATQVMRGRGGRRTSANRSRNQKDKTNSPVLTTTPPTFRENCAPLGEGARGSAAPLTPPVPPAQGLPPDALSREAGRRQEGPPQHGWLQDQGAPGAGEEELGVGRAGGCSLLTPESWGLHPSLWHPLCGRVFFHL